jgi:diguanylate cyclase (GGDEF)-like protein
MLDSGPLCCQLWDENFNIIGCNESAVQLYGFNNKQEFIERWNLECSPEYQPDGLRSEEKGKMYVRKAFTDGRCVFEWMHQMRDGTPMPAEITLVRIKDKGVHVVAGYTRDLRTVKSLEEKTKEVYRDALTGIYSRRYLDESLPRLIKLLSRSDGKLSIMMIDIDYFKKYNDTYGHGKGDDCLKIVAEALSKIILRNEDFIARYGGEEFTVVLPNTDKDGAYKIAEKMINAIRKCNIAHSASDIADHVTISIGGVTVHVNHECGGSEYLKQADEMLYKAKQNGRDRICF